MHLETERLRLAPWEADDWQAFRSIASDPDVMRYITGGAPWTDEQVREFVLRQMRWFNERDFCLWKLLKKSSGRLIGFAGLQPLVLGGAEEIEIGWWLARDCWGKGLATEAAREALRDGFDRAGLERVVAIARPENAASIRVMQKVGMDFEREITHKGIRHVLYSVREPVIGSTGLRDNG